MAIGLSVIDKPNKSPPSNKSLLENRYLAIMEVCVYALSDQITRNTNK